MNPGAPQLIPYRITPERARDPEWQAKVKAGREAAKLRRERALVLTTYDGARAIKLPALSRSAQLRDLAKRAVPGAMVELLRLLRTARDERVRLEAARLIFSYAEGEPTRTFAKDAGPAAGVNIVLTSPVQSVTAVTTDTTEQTERG